MLNSPKVVALRDTLARANSTITTSMHDLTDDRLRDQVCDVVEELKARGCPPERAVIVVKEIAAEAGLTQSRWVLSLKCDLSSRDLLLMKIVRWCIECYYDTPQPA